MADVILGIETSCDETAAAVVERATRVRSSVVASQIDRHARYGGVVPEIASRAHVELLVSGGHTLLVHMEDHGRYRLLGSTIDDAAGEAFDKVARFLGLGYPGGPVIDRIAADGDPHAIAFPRAMADRPYDFSFSGLKTAVVNHVRRHPDVATADVAASFQEAVVDVLVTKARQAARDVGAKGLCLGGGVAANSSLRSRFVEACDEDGIRPFVPSRSMCTDNAAMIAAAAWWRLRSDGPSPLDTGATPNLRLPVA